MKKQKPPSTYTAIDSSHKLTATIYFSKQIVVEWGILFEMKTWNKPEKLQSSSFISHNREAVFRNHYKLFS